MAVTNLKKVSQSRNLGNRNLRNGAFYTGNGAITATDGLVTNINVYPIGTQYFDLTGKVLAVRCAAAGVIGDWFESAAFTAAT